MVKETFYKTSVCLNQEKFISIENDAVYQKKYDGHLKIFVKNKATWGDRFFNYI